MKPTIRSRVKNSLRQIGVGKSLESLSTGSLASGQGIFESTHPSGHYYSAYPSLAEIEQDADRFFLPAPPRELPGIDMREDAQVELCKVLAPLSQIEVPLHRTTGWRYYLTNSYFIALDFRILAAMVRHLAPRRIIEIGSGFSSAAMLDVIEKYSLPTTVTCIEPYPDRLYELIGRPPHERCTVLEKMVQKIDLEMFDELKAGDILFVDSSHVSKIGSDVNHIIFNILPRLKPGVVVHFHDILYPFDYPRDWVEKGFGWNEAYLLRSFLQFNSSFEIMFYTSFMTTFHSEIMREAFPDGHVSGGIYLRRTR